MARNDMNRETLETIYRRLLERFGPQGWWPGETPFEVCVGAILVQNTSWANAAKAIENLKGEALLSPEGLSRVSRGRLARLIRPSRFFNQKARRLKNFVSFVAKNHEGRLDKFFELPTEILRNALLGLDGIGPETADSIILYAAGRPVFVVDAYAKRIFSRLGLFEESKNGGRDYRALQSMITGCLPSDLALFNEYHALLVRLGNTCCRPKPKCEACPLVDECPYPRKTPRPAARNGEAK